MIDKQGYRLNIGIVLANDQNKLFWGKRRGQANAWQFPQGGMQPNETYYSAMFRELYEELGLGPEDVEILSMSQRWRVYHLPKRYRRYDTKPLCIGQRQRWFLLRLKSDDHAINLNATEKPEFEDWAWVSYWQPVKKVIQFKRHVYRSVLKEFAEILFEESMEN